MALVEGKVALVTGGARGIGRASAGLLAAEGARVAVADVNLRGILVNTLCPGVIDTAMPAQFPPDRLAAMIEATPLRRMGTADEVAKVVLFLASDLSSFVTGAHIDINVGLFTD